MEIHIMKTMRLIAFTQYHENYSDSSRPYWKAKGGNEYVIAKLSMEAVIKLGQKGMQKMVDDASKKINIETAMVQEYVIDWDIVQGLTQDEKSQMEYEGKVIYRAQPVEKCLGVLNRQTQASMG
jgi:hypothetical protein